MAEDLIRYDLLAQAALRGVVRTVLADAARKGLPGQHHFKISFDTGAPGVVLSDRLRARFPQAMTIILQHQFWDLAVREDAFDVSLSFSGVAEKLTVPLAAVTAFFDPSVEFGFQFQPVDAAAQEHAGTAIGPEPDPNAAEARPARKNGQSDGQSDGPGGEVVSLDRFRKK